MQLRELLDTHDLKHIGTKTKISEENLKKLFAKEFDGFKRVQALGFIAIIEREFKADLSALRQEAKSFFDDFEPSEKYEAFLHTDTSYSKPKKRGVWLKLFLLAALAALAWSLFMRYGTDEMKALLHLSKGDASKQLRKSSVEFAAQDQLCEEIRRSLAEAKARPLLLTKNP